jgi:hypothetical protein
MAKIIYGGPFLAFFAALLLLAAQVKWVEIYLANTAPPITVAGSTPGAMSFGIGLGSPELVPNDNFFSFSATRQYPLRNEMFGADDLTVKGVWRTP